MSVIKEYRILKRQSHPIDWDKIPALNISKRLWTDPVDIRAQAKLCYGDNALHVNMRAWEKEIRATFYGRPHHVSDDSCLEFFFCPEYGDERYFNIEFNPNGALYLGYGRNIASNVRLLVQSEEVLFHPEPYKFEGGWGITYRFPMEFIRLFYQGFRMEKGVKIRANCYKCGNKTNAPHYFAWNPTASVNPDFHRPSDFGKMVFV